MENATKALIIAGGMLIAMIIVGLLVFGYTQLRQYQQTAYDEESTRQLADFNERFEAYNRTTVRGYQIISLGNLVYDTNIRYADYQGYEDVAVQVKGLTNLYDSNRSPDEKVDLVNFVQETYNRLNGDQKNAVKEAYFECTGVTYGVSGRVTRMEFSNVKVINQNYFTLSFEV